VISGLIQILRNKPEVIVSTYPIASAHVIAYVLHRLTGVPWVADLRDPMAQEGYPSDPQKKKWFEWIERKIVRHCRYAMVTAPGAKEYYEGRFPDKSSDFWQFIPNGYDETLFSEVADLGTGATTTLNANKPAILLHSGIIYPSERDPTQFFSALSELKQEGRIDSGKLEVRLRSTGHDQILSEQIRSLGIGDLVRLEPTVPYREALAEMFAVDALLLLQAANCNYQIPAKVYEYLRVRKPILALTPPEGDTGRLMSATGAVGVARLDSKEQIKAAILGLLDALEQPTQQNTDPSELEKFSRQYQAGRFEALLNALV